MHIIIKLINKIKKSFLNMLDVIYLGVLVMLISSFFLFSNATYASGPYPQVYTLWNYCLEYFSQCKAEGLYNNPSDLEIKEEYMYMYIYSDNYKFKTKWSDTYPVFQGFTKHIREEIIDTFNILWIGNRCNSDYILAFYQLYAIHMAEKGSNDMRMFTNKILFLNPDLFTNEVLCAGG